MKYLKETVLGIATAMGILALQYAMPNNYEMETETIKQLPTEYRLCFETESVVANTVEIVEETQPQTTEEITETTIQETTTEEITTEEITETTTEEITTIIETTEEITTTEEYTTIYIEEETTPYIEETTFVDRFTDYDYQMMWQCIETEVFEQSFEIKCNIASVILNRVNQYGCSPAEVVTAPHQFAYFRTNISDDTKMALQYVIENGDTTGGCIAFRSDCCPYNWYNWTYQFYDGSEYYYK